jgi:hypothetical protein
MIASLDHVRSQCRKGRSGAHLQGGGLDGERISPRDFAVVLATPLAEGVLHKRERGGVGLWCANIHPKRPRSQI